MVIRVPPEAGPRLGLTRSNVGVYRRSSPEGSGETAGAQQGRATAPARKEREREGGGQLTYHEAVELLRLRAEVSRAVADAELRGPRWRAGHQRLLHLTHDPRGRVGSGRRSGPGARPQAGGEAQRPHSRTHLSALTYSVGMALQRTPATRTPTSREVRPRFSPTMVIRVPPSLGPMSGWICGAGGEAGG